ncbi:uncharacterized protein [Rutidosis leptorrhynchoides]|uniref:uncharacterized protein n=1 Tax=Rutidosis leptorrhynchoides TaxID=125765 RepID=UPI003A992F44
MAEATNSPSPPPSSPPHQPPPNPKPICTWTHHETENLIQAYREKWYSLNRGQLKATQWEEIAVTISVKCGYEYSHPSSKSAIQCRHRWKSSGSGTERRSKMAAPPLPPPLGSGGDDDEEDEESRSKSRSINYILRKPTYVNRFSAQVSLKRPRVDFVAAEEDGGNVDETADEGIAMAAEIRRFAERWLGWRSRRWIWLEEWRMEMENKRMEMIVNSQTKIVDMVNMMFNTNDDDEDQVMKMEELERKNLTLLPRNHLTVIISVCIVVFQFDQNGSRFSFTLSSVCQVVELKDTSFV